MTAKNDVTAVITAMTDGERPFLAECVDSTISDPGVARAIVCVSEKNTWVDEVLSSFAKDPRVEIVRLPMAKPGTVRNEGVKRVRTEWVAFCDGDDVWCKGKTLRQLEFALEQNCDFVGSDHYLTDAAGRIRAVALAKYIPMPSSWLVRASVMRKHQFISGDYEDAEWWFRTQDAFPKGRYSRLLLRYRVRGVSFSTGEPSKVRKMRAVALGSIPVIGLGVLVLTWGMWLMNRSKSYQSIQVPNRFKSSHEPKEQSN